MSVMKSPSVLVQAIAIEVYGARLVNGADGGLEWQMALGQRIPASRFRPSQDLAEAMAALHLLDAGFLIGDCDSEGDERFYCGIGLEVTSYGETVEQAICKAVLAYVRARRNLNAEMGSKEVTPDTSILQLAESIRLYEAKIMLPGPIEIDGEMYTFVLARRDDGDRLRQAALEIMGVS